MTDFLTRLADHFVGLEERLNELDAAIGDGDHGTTICRGLAAAATDPAQPAKAFRRAAGGASGSLFGVLIGALSAEQNASPPTLGAAWSEAAPKITHLGGAGAGDKTMLDALIPAAAAAKAADSPEAAARNAASAADAGAKATQDMSARRGRAKYVENAGQGSLDPGAHSVAEILEAFASWRFKT
ncbi:MAG: DAK2 domain-containing protein [Bacteroidetes bacterium]|nr:DAK2 domain-containing protein [Bacteroidota bacterium]